MPKRIDPQRRQEALRRCADGESQHQVARDLGIAQATLSRHWRARNRKEVR
jgi:transposase-like protein